MSEFEVRTWHLDHADAGILNRYLCSRDCIKPLLLGMFTIGFPFREKRSPKQIS